MKKVLMIIALNILLAFGVLVAVGLPVSFGMAGHSMAHSSPCPLMGEAALCTMSPLYHIKYFQNLLLAVFPNATLFTLGLLFVVLAIFALRKGRDLSRALRELVSRFFLDGSAYFRFQYKKAHRLKNPILQSLVKIHPRLFA